MPSSNSILTQAGLYNAVRSELFAGRAASCANGVGLELELFAIVANSFDGEPCTAPIGERGAHEPSLMALFDAMIAEGGWSFVEEGGGIALARDGGGRITLEPAGQIEYSGAAKGEVREALADLRSATDALMRAAESVGIELVTRGYNNICSEDAIPLHVKKARYRVMDTHFARIGPFGRKMMRATCSLQINLDFGRPAQAAERWRLANMIAPSLNAIFANSPHWHDGARYRSFRHEIWRRTDPTRTGRLYDRPDLDPVADYLRFALDASVMMIRDENDGASAPRIPMTFREWLAGRGPHGYPDWSDWQLHLTTLFPDVRARGWMELRSVDALPAEWWGVPVALATTLLYNDRLRRDALDLLERRERHMHPDEHEHGGFWRSDYETGTELLALVLPAIDDLELAHSALRYYNEFCARGLVPADLITT